METRHTYPVMFKNRLLSSLPEFHPATGSPLLLYQNFISSLFMNKYIILREFNTGIQSRIRYRNTITWPSLKYNPVTFTRIQSC